MNARQLVGIALITAGVLGLVYGSFSYTKETHETKLGPIELSVKDLRVHDLSGEAALDEFCRQLGEIQTALHHQDFVLLADILQYEMDGAVANWMALLEATLGVVEPVAAS